MMSNRKQPFGYKVAMGEIVHHPQEAKLVEYIFRQYLSGSTFNALVTELQNQPTPYDVGKVWNKNMVARILEDKRYTGDRSYPPIVEREMLNKVLEKRSTKQISAPKNEAQKLLRRLSGHVVTKQMEQEVLRLLNRAIEDPAYIKAPDSEPMDSSNIQELQRELDAIMVCKPIDEDAAHKLIQAIAAAQYGAISSCEYETVRLQQIFTRYQPMTELDAKLLQVSVAAILVHSDGSLQIKLKNNQVIERR